MNRDMFAEFYCDIFPEPNISKSVRDTQM